MMLAHNTKMQVCPKDKPALISYEIVRQYPGFTLVRLRQGSVPIIIFFILLFQNKQCIRADRYVTALQFTFFIICTLEENTREITVNL